MGRAHSISIFVLIGFIILISVSFLAYKLPRGVEAPSEGLSLEKTNTKYYIDTCLDHTTTNAVELFGFNSENAVASYVDLKLVSCVGNFSFIKDYNVEYGKPSSNVLINEEVVFVDLNFPVKIFRNNTSVEIEEFQYSLKRLSSFKIEGSISAGSTFFSSDENMVVSVSEDTVAIDENGKPIEKIAFNLLDKNFNELSNEVVLGNIVYEGLPSGAIFDPPLKVTIGLRKEELPLAYPKIAPQIAYYDELGDIWRTYPSLGFDEDENYYYYSAQVSHFTPMAVVTCGGSTKPEPYFMGYVYRHLIKPSEDTYWRNNPDTGENPEGLHLIPEAMGNASCTKYDDSMIYNYKGTCDSMIKDWDEDTKEVYTISGDDTCRNSCLTLGEALLECYYGLDSCSSESLSAIKNPSWWYSPIDKMLLSYENMFIGGTSLSCTGNVCDIPSDSISYEPIEDDKNIKGTLEKETRFFATPYTYGYPSFEDVGGSGKFIIDLKDGGDACVDSWYVIGKEDKTLKSLSEATGDCSKEDKCSWSLEGNSKGELVANENTLIVEVENLNKDQKAYASGYLHFKGEGISVSGNPDDLNSDGGGGFSELGGGTGGFLDIPPGDFQELYPGIEMKKVDNSVNPEIDIPRHVVYYVVKIDLTKDPNFFVTPRQETLMQTSQFLSMYGPVNDLVLAINGGGFEYGGGNENVGYYAMSSGDVYSSPDLKINDATFVASKENKVGFGNSVDPYHAVTGFQTVSDENGVLDRFSPDKIEDGHAVADPRTGIGLDEKNDLMYIVVVNGRGAESSEGVNLRELGEIFVHHKATHGVNMDGGGSTTLVADQGGTPLLVNTPSDPGGERGVANHLGVGVSGGSASGTMGGLGLGGGGRGNSDMWLTYRSLTSSIFVGGQPNADDFLTLKEQGFTTIVDLACEDPNAAANAQAAGLSHTCIALGGYIRYPRESAAEAELISRVRNAINIASSGQKSYVHCTYGVHRTGMFVGYYGMKNLGWSHSQAEATLRAFGGSTWDNPSYNVIFDILKDY